MPRATGAFFLAVNVDVYIKTVYNDRTYARKGDGMEKRTKHRRYNTGAAMSVYTVDGVTLHRKLNGEYFLSMGSEITPLPYEVAKTWGEEHLPPVVYNEYFGKVTLGGKKTTYSFRLSAGAAEILKREAAKGGESLSDIVERAIWMYSE